MKVFLSHSSNDKLIIRRLNKDLTSHGFETWLDGNEVPHGASIPASISRGLSDSQILVLCISRHSVASKWVAAEWESALSKHLNGDGTKVIPLRLDDSAVPVFLTQYRYSDFREKDQYEQSLSLLLDTLNIYKSEFLGQFAQPRTPVTSILQFTQELLEDLNSEFVSLPMHRRIMIVDTLKQIPRSGKKVRLENFKPAIRVRSVYDHMLSLAHSADCLLPIFEHSLKEHEYASLAQCIAYHELNEVVLGDIPTYTSLSSGSRHRARILAEERLRSVEPRKREDIANKFIWMFLGEKHRRALDYVSSILANDSTPISVIFKMFDKIDPIIATWRYLHYYRGKLGPNPSDFNRRMKDFYENPDVKAFITAKQIDRAILDLVANLQDRRKAWDYYEGPDRVFDQKGIFTIPEKQVRELIEGFPLFHYSGGTASPVEPVDPKPVSERPFIMIRNRQLRTPSQRSNDK
jgi:5'-deoxynucleotidase YfbR-like HD superfamily hydrolase